MAAGQQWRFRHAINHNTALIDAYKEFSTAGMTWTRDERLQYAYDARDRLTSVTQDAGAGGYTDSYSYNASGNLLSKGGQRYTYPASGLNSVRPHACGGYLSHPRI